MAHSRIILGLWQPLAFVVAVAVAVAAYNEAALAGAVPAVPDAFLVRSEAPFNLSSFALSLLLVFRTNSSYARWLDARKAWGSIVNRSRDLVRQVRGQGGRAAGRRAGSSGAVGEWRAPLGRAAAAAAAGRAGATPLASAEALNTPPLPAPHRTPPVPPPNQGLTWIPADRAGLQDMLVRWTVAFARTTKCHLREGDDVGAELAGVLPPHELAALLAAQHRPLYALQVRWAGWRYCCRGVVLPQMAVSHGGRGGGSSGRGGGGRGGGVCWSSWRRRRQRQEPAVRGCRCCPRSRARRAWTRPPPSAWTKTSRSSKTCWARASASCAPPSPSPTRGEGGRWRLGRGRGPGRGGVAAEERCLQPGRAQTTTQAT